MGRDSSDEPLAEKHERNREQRIAEIERWVAYVRNNPPEVWGEQLNTLIESQLQAAQESGVTAEQRERVEKAGREFVDDRERVTPRPRSSARSTPRAGGGRSRRL